MSALGNCAVWNIPGALAWGCGWRRSRTLGLYQHREAMDPKALAEVDRLRRFEWHKKYLQDVLAAGPDPTVDANMNAVRASLREAERNWTAM